MIRETTALGAAYLAGLAAGIWKNTGEIKKLWRCDTVLKSNMETSRRSQLLKGWHKAVGRSLNWEDHE